MRIHITYNKTFLIHIKHFKKILLFSLDLLIIESTLLNIQNLLIIIGIIFMIFYGLFFYFLGVSRHRSDCSAKFSVLTNNSQQRTHAHQQLFASLKDYFHRSLSVLTSKKTLQYTMRCSLYFILFWWLILKEFVPLWAGLLVLWVLFPLVVVIKNWKPLTTRGILVRDFLEGNHSAEKYSNEVGGQI